MLRPGTTAPEQYQALLQEKCAALLLRFAMLPRFSAPSSIIPSIFSSVPEAYRQRAEFRIWHHDGRVDYAMQLPGKEKNSFTLNEFKPGALLIQRLMPVLIAHINASTVLKERLFEACFLTTLKGEALVTLIYHKTLNEEWLREAEKLKQQLREVAPVLHIIGRSRGQKLCLDEDFIHESLMVHGKSFHYQQREGAFTQPNALVNQHMLEWACSVTKSIGGDLLELYCGNGNFTLPLSQHFGNVLATEVSKTSIESARHNIASNGITNIELARLSSEEAAQSLARVRPFRRLQHLDLDRYRFSTVLVDPPRVGLDAATLDLVRGFDHICYISCNPETLLDNLQALMNTHRMEQLAFFDQFPYTHHMECGVLLRKVV